MRALYVCSWSLQSALRLDPSSVAAYNNMGGALAAQGLAGPALCAYALALSLDPQRVGGCWLLGEQ
jgi:cytochrome c-type biogenesis protein CcmH/NrfG